VVNRLENPPVFRLVSLLVNRQVNPLMNHPASQLMNLQDNHPISRLLSLPVSPPSFQPVPHLMFKSPISKLLGIRNVTASLGCVRTNALVMEYVTRISIVNVFKVLMVKMITWVLIVLNVCVLKTLPGWVWCPVATTCIPGRNALTRGNVIVKMGSVSALTVMKALHVHVLYVLMIAMIVEPAGLSNILL
jgi:hypothetical protein